MYTVDCVIELSPTIPNIAQGGFVRYMGKHPLSDFSLNYKQRWLSQGCWNIWQSLARSLFWVLRRDRELSSFSLVPRDENEILSTESRVLRRDREFCFQNLGPWDEIENLFLKSRNSRRDGDFSIILPKHISKSEKNVSHKRSNITVQLEEEGKCQSKPRLDFDHTLLNPWKAILEWRQSNCKCNISLCTFTFVQLDSIHYVLMILEVGWKWKIFTESSVIMLGEIIWFWLNIMWWLK